MPWEERNGREYYYRKVRDGDTVRSVYVGSGRLAQIAAHFDEERRLERERRRRNWQETRERFGRTQQAALNAERFIRAVRDAALIASGYHTHKGQWRKSRSYDEQTIRAMTEGNNDDAPNPEVNLKGMDIPSDVLDLMNRTRETKEDPSPEDRIALREALRDCPEVLDKIGDVAKHARDVAVKANFNDETVRAAVREKMNVLRGDLTRDGQDLRDVPTTERLLIEQVVICWLQFYAVQIKHERVTYGSHSLKRGRYWEKRLDAAQRRYLRALRTLTNVRKMNITVQINSAENQQIANL